MMDNEWHGVWVEMRKGVKTKWLGALIFNDQAILTLEQFSDEGRYLSELLMLPVDDAVAIFNRRFGRHQGQGWIGSLVPFVQADRSEVQMPSTRVRTSFTVANLILRQDAVTQLDKLADTIDRLRFEDMSDRVMPADWGSF